MLSVTTEGGRARSIGIILPLTILLAIASACTDPAPVIEATADSATVLEEITRPGDGGAVHLVRLVQDRNDFAFEPDSLELPPGDVVRFVMVDAQPESVVFRADSATSEAADFIRANSLQMGIVLTDPGQTYDVSLRDAPAGRYPFESIPHGAEGMRGVVVVVSE